MTTKEINKKYKGKYIEVSEKQNWENKTIEYEVLKVYDKIHENTTRGEDVGTEFAYTR